MMPFYKTKNKKIFRLNRSPVIMRLALKSNITHFSFKYC